MRRQTAVLCLALAVFASSLAAIHVHPLLGDEGPRTTHCLICIAAHSPSVLAAAVAPLPDVSRSQGTVRLAEADHRSRLVSPDLFIRPPPAV
jgi:hypothetical protein